MKTREAGFTLLELMVTVAIVAVVASISVPKLMSARLAANENAAIATLRTLTSAQSQMVAQCAIDTDADGGGEYAYIGELVGVANLRFFDAANFGAAVGGDTLQPSLLPPPFGDLVIDVNGHGVAERTGYYFKMWLPEVVGGAFVGVPEDGTVGIGGATAGRLPHSSASEIVWCCYAWPAEAGVTGNRAFFVNQLGTVLQTPNLDGEYDGIADAAAAPVFDAAYSNATGGGDMRASLGVTAMILPQGAAANDGNVWSIVEN